MTDPKWESHRQRAKKALRDRDLERAEQEIELARGALVQAGDATALELAAVHGTASEIYIAGSRLDEAIVESRMALEQERRIAPPTVRLADRLLALAQLLVRVGELAEARALMLESLPLKEKAHGRNHGEVAHVKGLLTTVERRLEVSSMPQ